jgi:hypothetical protein
VIEAATVELTERHEERIRALAVPGAYWSKERGHYCLDNPTGRAARAAITLFPHVLQDHPDLIKRSEADYGIGARPYNFADEFGSRLNVGPLGPHELYDWQDTDLGYLYQIMLRDGGVNILWDRGLGKTTATAAFIQKLNAVRSVVVCRNDTKVPVWEKQLARDPGLLPDHRIVIIPNDKLKRERQLDAIASGDFDDERWVWIIHYEAIALIAGEKIVKHKDSPDTVQKGAGNGWQKLGRFEFMAYDEGHRLANYNPNSKKNPQFGRGLSRMRRNTDYAVNLTGSGVTNRPEDMFGQLHMILPKIYKAKWADWNDRFLDYVDDGHRRVCIGFKSDTLPSLRRELGVFTVYRRKDEVFDLPPLIHQNIELSLEGEQRRAYEEMRDQFWTRINEVGVKASSPMAQMHNLRRIATYFKGLTESVKLDFALKELEETPDEQFVVFTWYKEPGRALAERLGDEVIVVDGDVSSKHRPSLLQKHEAGHARILVGSIATLGESLNLQYMHEAIRLDRDWNPEVNGQTIDRLNRHGQETRVTLRDLWALDTVDTLSVRPNLASKESLRRALFS